MSGFETIILLIYYLFAFVYTSKACGIEDEKSIWIRLMIALYSMTAGVIYFPGLFAEDVYRKLNKKT